METSSCLPEPSRAIQLLTPPKSPSTINSPAVMNDVRCVLLTAGALPSSFYSKPPQSDGVQTRKRHVLSMRDDFVCEACRQIDFRKVLDLDAATLQMKQNRDGIFIASLGTRVDQASGSRCALCRVFSAVRIPAHPDQKPQKYQLWAFSLLKNSHFIQCFGLPEKIRKQDQPYLAVVSATYDHRIRSIATDVKKAGPLFCYEDNSKQKGIFVPQVVPRQLNYSDVVQRLNYCRSHHVRLCRSEEPRLAGLKLFDCNSLSVIPAPPSSPYAALSYVWTSSKRGSRNRNAICTDAAKVLRPYLPNVVLDAIQATKAVGLQYLWVDKLCIDQDNPAEKHDQISQMGAIYRGAEVTIIAAAGEDEDYGLPGVGNRQRRAQPVAKIGNIRVVSGMAHPHITIRASKWWTRAWTYQEAVLSQRCLVFTEDQVYFECNAMNCSESLQGPLNVLHLKDKSMFLRFMHSGILLGKDKDCFGALDAANRPRMGSLQRYLDLASQYTARDLSFEEDALKAFAGIMRHLEKSRYPIYQIWGVPFYKHLVLGLSWSHKRSCWSTSRKPRRRSRFPSWSWAGWAGEVCFPPVTDKRYIFIEDRPDIYLEVEAGCLMEYSYLPDNPAEDSFRFSYPLALHLDAWVLPAKEIKIEDPGRPSNCRIGIYRGTLSLSQGPADRNLVLKMFGESKFELLMLGEIRKSSVYETSSNFLVIENYSDFACRVGTVETYDDIWGARSLINPWWKRRRVCLK